MLQTVFNYMFYRNSYLKSNLLCTKKKEAQQEWRPKIVNNAFGKYTTFTFFMKEAIFQNSLASVQLWVLEVFKQNLTAGKSLQKAFN